MSGSTRTSADLDVRRRRILFRSWHRGIREMDLLMGRFADAALADLSDAELDEFERLLDVPDHDLFAWLTGEAETPPNYDTPLFKRLGAFHEEQPSATAT
jgi:antitoxin CptB